MLENFVDKMKVFNDSRKADKANRSEKSSLNQRKEEIQKQLQAEYNGLGKALYTSRMYDVPEEYAQQFRRIAELHRQILECDAQVEESDRVLNDRKKELEDRRQEIAERERQQKEEKKLQKQQKNQEVDAAEFVVPHVDPSQVCPSCGAILQEGDSFCQNCGRKLEQPVVREAGDPAQEQEKEEPAETEEVLPEWEDKPVSAEPEAEEVPKDDQ